MKLRIVLCAFAASLALPAAAFAQAGSLGAPELGSAAAMQSLRGKSGQSYGLKSGEFILTPSLGIDLHHDTNVFNGNEKESGNAPISATSLRLMPGLGLTNGTDSEVQFALRATGDGRAYFTDNDAVSELTRFGGSADLGVTFFRRRAISLTLSDNFRRSLQANNWETTETLNRISNAIGARVAFHPGEIPERRPLEIALSGSYVLDRFDDFSAGDTSTIRSRLTGSWRFLPMTAVLLDASWDFRSFESPSSARLTANSTPWRVQGGLAGAITQTISFRATAGWGMSLHDTELDTATFSGYLADVGLLYRPSALTMLSLNYKHDFRDSFYGNYFEFHQVVTSLQQGFGSLMTATAWFSFNYATYGEFTNLPAGVLITQKNRRDYQLTGGIRGRVDVSRLIGVNIGYTFRGVITNFQVQSDDAAQRILDAGAYTAHELYAGVVIRY